MFAFYCFALLCFVGIWIVDIVVCFVVLSACMDSINNNIALCKTCISRIFSVHGQLFTTNRIRNRNRYGRLLKESWTRTWLVFKRAVLSLSKIIQTRLNYTQIIIGGSLWCRDKITAHAPASLRLQALTSSFPRLVHSTNVRLANASCFCRLISPLVYWQGVGTMDLV